MDAKGHTNVVWTWPAQIFGRHYSEMAIVKCVCINLQADFVSVVHVEWHHLLWGSHQKRVWKSNKPKIVMMSWHFWKAVSVTVAKTVITWLIVSFVSLPINPFWKAIRPKWHELRLHGMAYDIAYISWWVSVCTSSAWWYCKEMTTCNHIGCTSQVS